MGDWTKIDPPDTFRIVIEGDGTGSPLFEIIEVLRELDVAVAAIEFPLDEGPSLTQKGLENFITLSPFFPGKASRVNDDDHDDNLYSARCTRNPTCVGPCPDPTCTFFGIR